MSNKINIDKPDHFETDYIRVQYNKNHYVDEIWKDFANDVEVKLAQDKVFEIMKNTKSTAYIANMIHFKGTSPEIQMYVLNEWFPKMWDMGLRTIAMVVPPDIFGEFSLDTVIAKGIADKINKEKFTKQEDAAKWILDYCRKYD